MQCKAAVLFISLVPNNLLGTKLQYFGTIPPTQLKNITDLGHFKIHGTKNEHSSSSVVCSSCWNPLDSGACQDSAVVAGDPVDICMVKIDMLIFTGTHNV